MKSGGISRAVLYALAAFASAAQAQDLDASRIETALGVSAFYTDNFYYNTRNSGTKKSAVGGLFTPRAGYKGMTGGTDLTALLDGEYGAFNTPGSHDDYTDGHAAAELGYQASQRSRFELRGDFRHGHDPFGTNRTENASVRDSDLDVWDTLKGGGLFHYGTPEARLNAEVGTSELRRTYTTNRSNTQFLDYRSSSDQFTLFYNHSPKTASLVDVVRTSVDFYHSFGPVDDRSGDEYRLRLGARWLATGKTSGDVRVGYYTREFDNGTFKDQGLDWQAGIQWAPRAQSVIALDTGRSSQESFRADTRVIITRSANLGWTQSWTAKTSSTLKLGEIWSDFVGAGRDDRLYNAGVVLNHSLTQYVSIFLNLDFLSRASNEPSSEFERFNSYLGVRFSR